MQVFDRWGSRTTRPLSSENVRARMKKENERQVWRQMSRTLGAGWLLIVLASSARAQDPQPVATLDLPLWGDRVFESRVTRVASGDSLVVRDGDLELLVRLARVSVPNHLGEGDAGARNYLATRLVGQVTVRIERESDGNEAARGLVLTDGTDVRQGLVARGLVWYCRGSRQEETLEVAESEARRAGLGVWGVYGRPMEERKRVCTESAL